MFFVSVMTSDFYVSACFVQWEVGEAVCNRVGMDKGVSSNVEE